MPPGARELRLPGVRGPFTPMPSRQHRPPSRLLVGQACSKAIITVTDGDASASAPSQITTAKGTNECHEAITAAQTAKTAGTWIYTVSYGSPSSGCSTDKSPTITPCAALLAIASDPTKFYAGTPRLPCRSQRDIGAEQSVQEHWDQPDFLAHAAR